MIDGSEPRARGPRPGIALAPAGAGGWWLASLGQRQPRDRSRRRSAAPWWPWCFLLVSVGVWVALSGLSFHQPVYVGVRHLRFFDLDVYRATAHQLLAGRPIYAGPVYRKMQFTYPPFAALAMLPVALIPAWVAVGVSVTVNLVCLLVVVRLTPSLARARSREPLGGRGRSLARLAVPNSAWGPAAAVAALLIWSEPVSTTIGYGQVDLLITLLVVWDMSRPRQSAVRGIGIGIASGLKLTPLIFIPYLALVGERRAALRASVTMLVTIAVGFAFAGSDSLHFWGGAFLDSSRTGNIADTANQSLTGLITWLSGTRQLAPAGLALDLGLALGGLALAAAAGRAGEPGAGFGICALTSLLVSPVSWTHHWVLMIPASAALLASPPARHVRLTRAMIGTLGVTSFLYLPELLGEGVHGHPGVTERLAGMPYVVIGLAVLAAAGAAHRGTAWAAPERLGLRGMRRSARPEG